MRIPGEKTAIKCGRWLRSRWKSRALILGYHRITDLMRDSYGICVSPKHFGEQMEALRKTAVPTPLNELVQTLSQGELPKRAVAVTFDDGYSDLLHSAKALLKAWEIPATAFVVSGSLGREFWWDELERKLTAKLRVTDQFSLKFEGGVKRFSVEAVEHRQRRSRATGAPKKLLLSIYEHLLPLDAIERERVLEQLTAPAAGGTLNSQVSRSLSADELVKMSRDDSLEIGSHSVTHSVLPTLSRSSQEAELLQSKRELERIIRKEVTAFSYPNGSYSQTTLELVKQAGFKSACASHPDVVRSTDSLFCLPRFWVPNWNGEKFERWLTWWI